MAHEIPRRAERQGRRHCRAGARLALAMAAHRHIDGQEQRRIAGGLGALDELAHRVAVAEAVELEPVFFLGRRGDLLRRVGTRAAQGIADAGGLRGLRAGDVAAPMRQRGHARRCQRERHRQIGAAEALGELGRGDACQAELSEAILVERGLVAGLRAAALGAIIDVGPDHFRQRAPRRFAPVRNARRLEILTQPVLKRTCHQPKPSLEFLVRAYLPPGTMWMGPGPRMGKVAKLEAGAVSSYSGKCARKAFVASSASMRASVTPRQLCRL